MLSWSREVKKSGQLVSRNFWNAGRLGSISKLGSPDMRDSGVNGGSMLGISPSIQFIFYVFSTFLSTELEAFHFLEVSLK